MSKTDEVRECGVKLSGGPECFDLMCSQCQENLVQLEQERDEARRVLAKHEWCSEGECEHCHNDTWVHKDQHKPDCEWLAAMGKVTP